MRAIRLAVYADPTADAYTITRDALALARRLEVGVWLRIDEGYSFDVDPEYTDEGAAMRMAESIINHRASQ